MGSGRCADWRIVAVPLSSAIARPRTTWCGLARCSKQARCKSYPAFTRRVTVYNRMMRSCRLCLMFLKQTARPLLSSACQRTFPADSVNKYQQRSVRDGSFRVVTVVECAAEPSK